MRLDVRRRSMMGRAVLGLSCSALCWALGCGETGGEPGPGDGDSAGGAMDTDDSSTDTDKQLCEEDADCSDSKYCNGVEECDPDHDDADSAGCVPGKKPCGDSACIEDDRTCGCDTPDGDQDGYDSIECGGDDCDDDDENRFPGNTEVCDDDDHDEDCDPKTFGERDEDDDGDYDDQCCNVDDDGEASCGRDCDDDDPVKYDGNTETCDDIDNDCDGIIDELPDSDEPDGLKQEYTEDKDRDGYGSRASSADKISACKAPKGYALSVTDCDDDVAEINPGAYDSCEDTVDNDCSDVVNDPEGGCTCEGNVSQTCGDGGAGLKGKCATYERQCNNGSWDDCPLKPGAQAEVCNDLGEDEDCDGLVDEAVAESPELEVAGSLKQPYFRDRDGDGYPDLTASAPFCPDYPSAGYIDDENPQDCVDVALATDPQSASIYPGAQETCNGRDDDCADGVDEPPLVGSPTVAGTTFSCEGGAWVVSGCPANMLHCDENVNNGCETAGNTLQNCGQCDKQCLFSCGGASCNEPTSLGLGNSTSCVIEAGGRISCWGLGTSGELGDGQSTSRDYPARVSSLVSALQVDGGDGFACAIAGANQALSCWGKNNRGQLGNDSTTPSAVPVSVVSNLEFDRVSAGQEHVCAIDSDGLLWCWGNASGGRTGDGGSRGTISYDGPVETWDGDNGRYLGAGDKVVQVVTGNEHTCALMASQKVFCATNGAKGQDGNTTAIPTMGAFYAVAGLTGVSALASGADHVCAIKSGQVLCWGANPAGQTGQVADLVQPTATPQVVPGLANVSAIAAGGFSTCAVTAGEVYCWGNNDGGQLGGTTGSTHVPQKVPGIAGVGLLGVGSEHACAQRTSDKGILCWGGNAAGQLGWGTTNSQKNPTPALVNPLGVDD